MTPVVSIVLLSLTASTTRVFGLPPPLSPPHQQHHHHQQQQQEPVVRTVSNGTCSHPAQKGCEPNSGCHPPACSVIGSTPCTDVGDCCSSCEADPRCGAYTLNLEKKTCWLRTSARERKTGHCLSGTVRPPLPPAPPPPPLPPQPPHLGVDFLGSPEALITGETNAASFYGAPCGNHTCIFGDSAKVVYGPSTGWRQMKSPMTSSFAMPGLHAGYLQTIGNLSSTSVDGSDFHGDGKAGRLRFHPTGELIWSLLQAPGKAMTYTGLPCRAYKFRINSGGTVRMDDGSLLQTVNYKCFNDSSSSRPSALQPLSPGHSTLGMYKSLNGVDWTFYSTVVSWHDTLGPDGTPEDEGPNENDIVRLPSSPQALLVVARADSGDGAPRHLLRAYWTVRSSDGGKSWSKPQVMAATDGSTMGSARPRLAMLGKGGKGPLLLTGGRPGLYLWVNQAADGKEWEKINLAAAHNAAAATNLSAPSAFRFCDAFVNASLATQDLREGICTLSMSYNSLVQTGDCEATIMYASAPKTFSAGYMGSCSTNVSTIFALRLAVSVGAGGCAP